MNPGIVMTSWSEDITFATEPRRRGLKILIPFTTTDYKGLNICDNGSYKINIPFSKSGIGDPMITSTMAKWICPTAPSHIHHYCSHISAPLGGGIYYPDSPAIHPMSFKGGKDEAYHKKWVSADSVLRRDTGFYLFFVYPGALMPSR